MQSKLLVPGANKRIATIDTHAGLVSLAADHSCFTDVIADLGGFHQAATGLVADGRHLANRAREEAENYKDTYRVQIPSKVNTLTTALPRKFIADGSSIPRFSRIG